MQIRTEKSFYVIGISARTSNAAEFSGAGVIGKVWQQFFSKDLLSHIPNRIDNDIIAVYFDYASDKDGLPFEASAKYGEYTFLLGARVKIWHASRSKRVLETRRLDHVLDEMVGYEVPAQKYAMFTSAQGQMPGVEVALWQKIWRQLDVADLSAVAQRAEVEGGDEAQEDAGTLKRAYIADYVVYDERAHNPAHAMVDIYIGLKH